VSISPNVLCSWRSADDDRQLSWIIARSITPLHLTTRVWARVPVSVPLVSEKGNTWILRAHRDARRLLRRLPAKKQSPKIRRGTEADLWFLVTDTVTIAYWLVRREEGSGTTVEVHYPQGISLQINFQYRTRDPLRTKKNCRHLLDIPTIVSKES